MYVRAYVRGGSHLGMSRNVVTYYRPYDIIYGDTFRYAQLREMCGQHSLAMEMEVGDDGTAGPSRLGY